MEVKETVCSFDSLYNAAYKAAKSVWWKDSVGGYMKNVLVNTLILRMNLLADKYKISEYTCFKIYEPKVRNVVSTRFKDRVFQRSLCDNYLTSAITKSFIPDNFACQKFKGTNKARERLKHFLNEYVRKNGLNGSIAKFDLQKYFDSTPHETVMNAIKKRVKDKWAINEVERIVSSFNKGTDPNKGIGLGSQVSQNLQLAVLDDLDHYIKEQLHIKYYLRYMDDFIMIHQDKQYLKFCQNKVKIKIELIGLKLSPKKTQIQDISQPISFLGFTYYVLPTGKVIMKIKSEKLKKERKKLRKLVSMAKEGMIEKSDVDKSLQSFCANANHGNSYNLICGIKKYYDNLWKEQKNEICTCSKINHKN